MKAMLTHLYYENRQRFDEVIGMMQQGLSAAPVQQVITQKGGK
jgi:hypothetical protein